MKKRILSALLAIMMVVTMLSTTAGAEFNADVSVAADTPANIENVDATVTFDANGHGANNTVSNIAPNSTIAAPTAPTADGWIFGGWYKDAACTEVWDFATDIVTGDVTLYAKWTEEIPFVASGRIYGKNMTTTEITLVADVPGAVSYQWQAADLKYGTYEDLDGAAEATYTFTPINNKWYRCAVNTDTASPAYSPAVKAMQVGASDTDIFTKAPRNQWYLSNNTMAYNCRRTVGTDQFDIVGRYSTETRTYWVNTSYNQYWGVGSTDTPTATGSYANTNLEELRIYFDEANSRNVLVEAELAENCTALAFGTDTMLGNGTVDSEVFHYDDEASLKAILDRNNKLQQIQMVGAASLAEAEDEDVAFVFTPVTEDPVFWIGSYYQNGVGQAYTYNTGSESYNRYYVFGTGTLDGKVVEIQNYDSAMAVSWTNLTPGSVVKFGFSIGDVGNTGAVTGSDLDSACGSVALELSRAATGIVVKVNGEALTEEIHYTIADADTPYPIITFLESAGLTASSVITVDVTLGQAQTKTIRVQNNIFYTITFDANDGSVTPANAVTGAGGKLDSLPVPTRSGYTFNGWYLADGTKVTTSTVFSADTTVTAQWSYIYTGGSGSSPSNITSKTEKNPDGSTTTTTTNQTTGTVNETTRNTDGTTGTTVTDKNGNITKVSAKVPAAAANAAEKVGKPVTVPVEVPAAKSSEDALSIKVDVPTGGAAVEIPVENVTPGTVVVIVAKDGTEQVVRTSSVSENGVVVKLEMDATIKVVDMKRDFQDVHPVNHWATDAIDFVAARGIFNGTSSDTFTPNGSMTRQAMWMTLARMSGEEPANMTAAREWAMANAVSDGSNPLSIVTRQQYVAMLWRWAAAEGMDVSVGKETNILSYSDAGRISDYAVEAFRWACSEGIVDGYNDGTLRALTNASRAHAAAMMMRFCASTVN